MDILCVVVELQTDLTPIMGLDRVRLELMIGYKDILKAVHGTVYEYAVAKGSSVRLGNNHHVITIQKLNN